MVRRLSTLLVLALVLLVPGFAQAQPTSVTALGNAETVLARASRTANTSTAWFLNPGQNRGMLVLHVWSVTATPSITIQMEVWDKLYGVPLGLLSSTPAVTAAGTYYYAYNMGSDGSINKNWPTPPMTGPMRWTITHADADAIEYALEWWSAP